MKKIIKESNLTVMATIARYASAYQAIAKLEWWDKSIWWATAPLWFYGAHLTEGFICQGWTNHRASYALLRLVPLLWR
jgi:hypothetical protein